MRKILALGLIGGFVSGLVAMMLVAFATEPATKLIGMATLMVVGFAVIVIVLVPIALYAIRELEKE